MHGDWRHDGINENAALAPRVIDKGGGALTALRPRPGVQITVSYQKKAFS